MQKSIPVYPCFRVLTCIMSACIWLAAASSFLQAQSAEKLKKKAISTAVDMQETIENMASKLWHFSETALRETASADFLVKELESAGFAVEKGVADMPTAFVATYGQGRPVIGILAEYDALPGVGNEPVPMRKPRADGITSGHGCGHNIFGAGSVGGALVLKKMMQENGLKGTIKLFGTPAEETVVGKVYMAKAGIFDGLDVALDWHPGLKTEVNNDPGRAMNNFEVEFFGQAAHASADPWNGRSALDAVEMMNYGVNLMREHVKPSTRIHYVIPKAGEAPNVVPGYAKVWYYVRDLNREEVDGYYQRILNIAEGAALATGTTHKVFLITGVHEYLHNRPLQEVVYNNLKLVGAPEYSEEEQAFAKSLQAFVEKKQIGFKTEIEPLKDELQTPNGGSTDVAEVSWIAPTSGFSVTSAAFGVPWHSWATTACHGTAAGKRAAQVAAGVIAATGIDLLTNPGLVKKIRAFFNEKTEGHPYKSPLPLEQKPPLPLSSGR